MSKSESYLNKVIYFGLYAILLTPLAFWPKALYPFATPKFLLFQILVEIVFGAWLILLIYRGGFTRIIADLRRNYIALALFGFFAISFFSALFGVDFQRSFWGIGPRLTGLFAELHFIAWFLVLASSLSNTNDTNKHANDTNGENNKKNIRVIRMPFVDWYCYLNFSFFVALAVAATAFYQNPGWGMAFGSTLFNNPTFVAPYFIFHFFWGLYRSIFNFQFSIFKLKGWLFGAGTILLFIAIILTQIRGAILGLLIGIFAFGLLLIFSNMLNQRLRNILVVIYLIFVIGIAGFWSFRDLPLIQNISILKKITTASLMETTVRTRLLTWQLALKGFWDKPILGVGPENFNYLFNAYYNPHFLRFGGGGFGETWFDKPHNAFLEILTETGIIGGLAYVIIWLTAGFLFLKLWRNGEKLFSAAIFSAFVAYLISIFFSFDSFGSWFGVFLFLAFLASHGSNTNTRIHTNDANKILKNFSLRNIFVTFVLIGIFVLEYLNYGIWRANLADADALRAFPSNPLQGIDLFKKSLNYFTPYKAEYQFDFAASVIGAVQKNIPLPDLENTLNSALEEIDKAIAAHPKNAAYYTDMLRVYNVLGELGRDPQILAQAEAFGRRSLELSPNRQETLFYLSKNAALKSNTKLAISWATQAVEADPTIKQSHWYLGLAYLIASQKNQGIVEIKKALELGYKPQNQSEANFIKSIGL